MGTTPRLRFLKKHGIDVKRNSEKNPSDDADNSNEESSAESDNEAESSKPNKHGLIIDDDSTDEDDEPLLKVSKRDVFSTIEKAKVSF